MRWEDERYVRVYVRDTADWVSLGWEAQALFLLAMRKMDRAGILDLGKAGTRGLAALVQMPLEVVERVLPVLLADGCLVLNGQVLVAPNFIAAQEAAQSDAHRKRESRAKAADLASAPVTPSHTASRNVTAPDASEGGPSELVTPCRTVPSRTVLREKKQRPLDVMAAHRDDTYPSLAAALAASGLDLTWSRRAEVNAAMDADAARLGPDRAGAVLRDAHAADPNGSLGWFKGALHSAAAGGPKVKPVDAWTPNPGLDVDPEEAERRWLASPERQAAIERGEIQA